MQKEAQLIAGVDEAGRGPLAGPVVAAAVILNPKYPVSNLKDSKLLSGKQREELYEEILARCLAYGVAMIDPTEIDHINILQASLKAMRNAVALLQISPYKVIVDGNQNPGLNITTEMVIQGDKKIPSISAASIIAKVSRDRIMYQFSEKYPEYGFSEHKGYGTKKHLQALKQYGPCPIHRKSFAPVKSLLVKNGLPVS